MCGVVLTLPVPSFGRKRAEESCWPGWPEQFLCVFTLEYVTIQKDSKWSGCREDILCSALYYRIKFMALERGCHRLKFEHYLIWHRFSAPLINSKLCCFVCEHAYDFGLELECKPYLVKALHYKSASRCSHSLTPRFVMHHNFL